MNISLTSLTRLREIYRIMIVLTTSKEISKEINNNGIVTLTIVDSILDALKACDDITCYIVNYRYGLKSEKIKDQCTTVIRILKTMKQNLLRVRDIITTNSGLTTANHDYDLVNDLVFSIDKLYRYISEEAESNAE